jgi:hypothetical protein
VLRPRVEPFDDSFSRVLSNAALTMPIEQRDRYLAIARALEANVPETAVH